MAMSLKEFGQLKKFMMMTTSGSDSERLQSIDHANRLLAKHSLTWDMVFAKTVTVVNEFEADPETETTDAGRRAAEARKVDQAFADVEATDPRGSFADFIASLKAQWETKRFLSPAQLEKLFQAANRANTEKRR